jgi:hypothetical protein
VRFAKQAFAQPPFLTHGGRCFRTAHQGIRWALRRHDHGPQQPGRDIPAELFSLFAPREEYPMNTRILRGWTPAVSCSFPTLRVRNEAKRKRRLPPLPHEFQQYRVCLD